MWLAWCIHIHIYIILSLCYFNLSLRGSVIFPETLPTHCLPKLSVNSPLLSILYYHTYIHIIICIHTHNMCMYVWFDKDGLLVGLLVINP